MLASAEAIPSTAGTSLFSLRRAYCKNPLAAHSLSPSTPVTLSSLFTQPLYEAHTNNMKATTIILSVVAAFVAVQAAPASFQRRDVDPNLVPDFGVVPGAGADGTGYVR